MILKKLTINFVKFYRYFISPALGNNCRYYPTCSEYAIWEIENDNFFKAIFKVGFRILRCNQFFKGGIDYPIIKKSFSSIIYGKKLKIKYLLIPIKDNKFYVIKVENE